MFREDADLATAQASLEKLKEPLRNFPFAPAEDEDGRNIYISMLFTLLLRPAIDGIVPCFFMRGNSQSLGKGLLCDMCSLIIFGECAPLISEPKNDAEWQSRIEGILMHGQEFSVIDNIVGNLNAPYFASVLTSRERNCRILGTSQMQLVPMNTVFSVNGNSVDTGSDLEERGVMICLEHKDARSRNINAFHIQKTYNQSPDTFVKERRAEFLQHLINLVCAWKNAGSPRRQKLTMSKYGVWESIVGGIFDFVAPKATFLSSNNANRAEANVEDNETIGFIEAVRREYPTCGTVPIVFSDIRRATRESDLGDFLPDALRYNDGYFANRFAKWMRTISTRIYDGYEVRIGTDREPKNNYLFVDTTPERHPTTPQQPTNTAVTVSEEEQWIVNNT